MARFLKSRLKVKGAAPGSLIFIGNQKMENPHLRLIKYHADLLEESKHDDTNSLIQSLDKHSINWINLDGLHNTDPIQAIGKHWSISPLILESILNTGQRPRLLSDDLNTAIIARAVYYNQAEKRVSSEQITFVMHNNTLISFQEQTGDHFEMIRERLRKNSGKIRRSSAGYLLYTLLDSLVDNYLIVMEQLGNEIEACNPMLDKPDNSINNLLFHLKTELSMIRRIVKPLKEVSTRIIRNNDIIAEKEIDIYYQELYDLIVQADETAEFYTALINDQLNTYNTNVNNRANEVMKVLTIFASIFIPLTFIAGIYGTNFDYLPELHYRYSYFVMWGIMIALTLVMLRYFKKREWF